MWHDRWRVHGLISYIQLGNEIHVGASESRLQSQPLQFFSRKDFTVVLPVHSLVNNNNRVKGPDNTENAHLNPVKMIAQSA